MTILKGKSVIPKEDDCNCGKSVKITKRKKIEYKKTINKKS